MSNPETVLLSESFAQLALWHREGLVNGVRCNDGKEGGLILDCTGSAQGGVGAMLFSRANFPDNIAVEFTLRTEAANGLLIVFLGFQGLNGEDAIRECPKREGTFADYVGANASVRSYHVSISRYNDKGEHTNTSNWRRNPGLHLMGAGDDLCKETGRPFRVRITKRGPELALFVDGQRASGFCDPQNLPGPIPSTGKVGFRAIGSRAIYKINDLIISSLV